jgi:uncharacterized protein YyaL (SSP411 family)
MIESPPNSAPANRLAAETSPYLLQHAANPVAWYAWGEEALSRARAEDKPILLSIGYSACHWCHVMAHESFEDPVVAEAMNRLFINVKVDREERPDLDQIYQLAHQMLTQRPGGWPLTMFLTPAGEPYFGGTYFPKTPRHGLPGFSDLCARVAAIYRERRGDIGAQNQALKEAFARLDPAKAPEAPINDEPLVGAIAALKSHFDPDDGGFGTAPKFPQASDLAFCLHHYAKGERSVMGVPDGDALNMVVHTLTRMAEGGVFDHLGGGFFRYSTDAQWTIPHFEKMLSDNGLLLGLYADAWGLTREPRFAQVVEDTAGWLQRDMQGPEGGFCAALDADSEGEEGRFYVWTPETVRAAVTEDEYAVLAARFGLGDPANFEGRAWHLRVTKPLTEVARELRLGEGACEVLLRTGRSKLLDARTRRIHPGRDGKVLVSWNALVIGGLARAGRLFGRTDWIAAAGNALDFIRRRMQQSGASGAGGLRLLACHAEGHARFNAYLDDYAFLLDATLELLQARFDAGILSFAEGLARTLQDAFEDRVRGGFFFTSHDHEALFHRGKPGHDHATPSGNGVASQALLRLSLLTGNTAYAQAAERAIAIFHPSMSSRPGGQAAMMLALAEALDPPRTVVVRGPDAGVTDWLRELGGRYRPSTLVLGVPDSAGNAATLPAVLAKPSGSQQDGRVNGWVCEGVTCLAPVQSLDALLSLLDAR